MLIDLSALLRGEIHSMDLDRDIEPGAAPDGIELLPGAHLSGVITDGGGGYIRLSAVATVPYRSECARCLETVTGEMEFDFDRTLVPEGVLSDEQLEEGIDEYLVIRRGILDIDEALSESIFLEFPLRILCSEDCGGLCHRCGRKLALGETCLCSSREIDPRWSSLGNIQWDEDPDDAENNVGDETDVHGNR